MKVVVVGGGPAGIIAALSAAQCGANVMLLEKNTSLGKKLLITGKGRCNITSSIDISDFIKNIPGNGRFLYSAFQNYTNLDIISLLEKNGVKVKEERGNRIFPVSDRAQDVLDALIKELKKYKNIEIRTNVKVKKILVDDSNFVSGVVLENNEKIMAGKVILATGGKSYPLTGSNGEGYEMAKVLGHSIENIRGSLVPITADSICQRMQGLSLKNVKITAF